jgi:hypothetical protein
VAKSANNLIHWAQIVAIDEALRMADALGVPASALRRAPQEGPTDSRTLCEVEQMRFTWYVKDIAPVTDGRLRWLVRVYGEADRRADHHSPHRTVGQT